MAYKVVVSDNVDLALNSIVYHLETKWSKKIAENFIVIFYKIIEQLSRNPYIGIKTEKDPLTRKKIITKHNVLYYEIIGEEIHLLNIFFAKQNPEKNTFE